MLDGKKVLIVGASGDIGIALCREFIAKGAAVTGTYGSNQAPLAALEAEFPGRMTAVRLDVRSADGIEAMCARLDESDSTPDVFIYNAGIIKDSPALGMEDEAWDDVIGVNLTGAFRVTKAVARLMSLRKSGKIFFVSSVAGAKGGRGQANYAASKAGIEAFARTLAAELARKNILVNVIAPGVIKSRMSEAVMETAKAEVLGRITLGRLGEPSEVARFAAHMSCDEITYVTGQVFYVDGGFKL